MATIEKPRVPVTRNPASSAAPVSAPNPSGNTAPGSEASALPDMRKFNALTATRSSVSRGILGRPMVGNVAEIVAGGVRGTPADLVERILEHEPPMGLLDEALRA